MIELFLTLHQSIKIPEYTFALPCSFFSLLLFIVAHVGHDSKTVSRLRACCFYLLLSVAQTQFQVDSSPQNQMCESVFINHCSWVSCPVLKMFVCLNKRKLQSIYFWCSKHQDTAFDVGGECNAVERGNSHTNSCV